MRPRAILAVAAPITLFIGCDLVANVVGAYDTGYTFGYSCVDSCYGCLDAERERREEREEEIVEWEDNCQVPVQDHFANDDQLDAADARCSEQYTSSDRIVICNDVGQEDGTEPPSCGPYNEPELGFAVDGSYACPSEVGAGYLCLCCSDVTRGGCELPGGFCREDADCCSGYCVLGPPLVIDGGVVEGAASGDCSG